MPYCKKCGSIATDENAQFCARCGSALERENDSFEGKRRPLHDVGERGQEDDAFEGSRRPLHDVAQPETENLPEKRYRPYQRVIAGIGVGCLVIVVGFAFLLLASAFCAPSDTNEPTPAARFCELVERLARTVPIDDPAGFSDRDAEYAVGMALEFMDANPEELIHELPADVRGDARVLVTSTEDFIGVLESQKDEEPSEFDKAQLFIFYMAMEFDADVMDETCSKHQLR